MTDHLANSKSFITSLEEFLDYTPLSPELCKILEKHCLSPNKSRRSEKIVRTAVIRAIHTFSLDFARFRNFDSNERARSKLKSNLRVRVFITN